MQLARRCTVSTVTRALPLQDTIVCRHCISAPESATMKPSIATSVETPTPVLQMPYLPDRRATAAEATEPDPIGAAIDSLDRGTASLTDLLTHTRAPLAGDIAQLGRLAPLLDDDKALLDGALQRAPENYRKLIRLGSYGSWLNIYICGLSVRISDQSGNTAVFPWFEQHTGRCSE